MPGQPPTGDLDTVVHLESSFIAEGTAASHAHGAEAGRSDGRSLGWASATALQSELQFHHGVAQALLSLSLSHPEQIPTRSITASRRVITLINEIPLHVIGNHPDVDMTALSASVRAQTRAALAAARLDVSFRLTSSRMSDLDF